MPRLSIIVPHVSEDTALELTLLSVLENRPRGVEVIVSHNGRYADPYSLGEDEIDMVDDAEAETVVELVNLGLAAASGTIVEILLPGCLVAQDWTEPAVTCFRDSSIASVSPKLSTCDGRSTTYLGLERNSLPRRAWRSRSEPGEQVGATLCGGFYRRNVVQALGGWLPSSEREVAEADMSLAIMALGMQSIAEPASEIIADRKLIEGRVGGYALGHASAQLATAYSLATNETMPVASLASRIGNLAGGLINPGTVAERLGWVVGCNDRSLVQTVRQRIELAEKRLGISCEYHLGRESDLRAA